MGRKARVEDGGGWEEGKGRTWSRGVSWKVEKAGRKARVERGVEGLVGRWSRLGGREG